MESAFKKAKTSHDDTKENQIPKKISPQYSNNESKSIGSLQVLAEVSSNSLREMEFKPSTSKQSNNQVPKSREFCCVYRNCDKKFFVISTSCIRVQNVDSILLGKTYDVLIGDSYVKGIVKYLGNNSDCFNQLKHLESLFKPSQTQAQSLKRKNASTDNIKSVLNKPSTETVESLKSKVRLLENQLKEKDQIIEQQKEEIRIKKDLISFYNDNFNNESIHQIRKFCTSFIETFGSGPIVDLNNNLTDEVFISPNYMDVTVSPDAKNEMDSFVRRSENGAMAFRQIIQMLIPDSFIWAKNSRKSMMEVYNRVIKAAWEYVSQSHFELMFDKVPDIIGQISSNNRAKLQNRGYKIITTFDTFTRSAVYEIFKPGFNHQHSFNLEENDELNENIAEMKHENFDDLVKPENDEEDIEQYADVERN